MKTFLPKTHEIERKWYSIDAKGITLGKLAVLIANILRGKNKTDFFPSVDTGDYVIVTNCDKFLVTGNKMIDKTYYSHSRAVKDGLKKISLGDVIVKKPEFPLREAVYGMLPKNSLRSDMIIRLKLFSDSEHNHQAQMPTVINLVG